MRIVLIFITLIFIAAVDSAYAERLLSRREAIDRTLDEWELRIHEKVAEPAPPQPPAGIKDMIKTKGYFKTIALASEDYSDNKDYFESLNRLRLDFDVGFSQTLSAKATWDNQLILGDILKSGDFKVSKTVSENTLFDLKDAPVDNDNLYWDTSLYRGYVKYDREPFIAILGRQRIAWSVAKLWETVDYFNPVSPLAIEPDERIGVDALDFEWKTRESTRLEGVYAPQTNYKNSSLAAKVTTLIGEYDLSFLGGKFGQDKAIAFTFDGYLADGGLRGEVSHIFAHNDKNYQRFDIGYDYTFPNTLYLLFEYLYNGGALNKSLVGDFSISNQIKTKNKHLVGFMAGYDVTPLLRTEGLTLYDPKQKSLFIMPTLKYSIITNLDLMLGAQFFAGRTDSEFGAYHDIYYSWLQWYF